ncbi:MULTISPECIES: flagellar hook-associated protein FlgK [unclassified Caulobacter]|uniref:flagellar hook-associated protein FlgK n=1 Tax=unclassified Caulobacter TaxID=2648921 RepID=UPI0006F2CC9A|nr:MULTISPECIES: flagellar hook-associated protein FlgK [unclassified Caulobacter]KQV58821.1 flagellar biosynthesis protein FlgK [Caulobacter sp. Root342]KQV68670.1 flagellar biosynthesis protein FlgK [Caulobacter sp. Root343]
MSLNAIMNTATSGMMAAQTGLRVTSDNIANVNTTGYVRKTIAQSNLLSGGMGVGVSIDAIKRATDRFLQSASLNAASDSNRAGAISQALNTAQQLFGDPSGDTSFFSTLDDIFTAFSSAQDDPSSSLLRTQALTRVDDFLSESSRITSSLSKLGKDADTRISADVDRVNDLLSQIDGLNTDITRAKVAGADATGAENVQSGLVDELSKLMNVQVSPRTMGGVVVRSTEGLNLAGDGAAKVTYQTSATATGYLTVQLANGSVMPTPLNISSGEIKGLMEVRNTDLVALSDQLGEFTSRAAEEINRAANAASSVPAATTLSGRDTGLDSTAAVTGMTGKTTIALTDASGVMQRRIDVDFDTGTLTVNGVALPPPAFTPADFVSKLNAAMGGQGTAGFSGGALTLNGTGGLGVAVADDPTTPATKAGKGFSHYFGLNDIIRTNGYSPYETGLTAGDPNGFTSGTMTVRLTDVEGGRIRDISVDPPIGGTMQDMLDALNSRASGTGLYGTFSLNGKGQISFASNTTTPVSMSIVADTTERGVGGPSASQLFGIGPAERSTRGEKFFVNAAMDQNPKLLPFAQLDLAQAVGGSPALAIGDGRGALALAKAGETITNFSAAGDASAVTMTVSRYASDFSGSIGRRAATAESRKDAAEAVSSEVNSQRQSEEGVNLDEELINLTTYQQAFNASARLIQATKDMFDVLVGIMG